MPLVRGDRLGPYEIRSRIGAGGMGEVYAAFDGRLRRDVAIKVLPETATSPTSRARFEREAQAVAALSHPNVLSVFDVGTHDEAFYIVTELLEGRTLRDILANGPLPVPVAIDYARQAAAALQSAHAKGIIHRDIKPENLFVTTDGRLKVLDFGLARVTDDSQAATAARDARLTGSNVVLGTIGYMSPEQVRGEPIDQRSDIFSLGCVLYEMLGGRSPFLRNSQTATVAAILNDAADFAPLSYVAPRMIAVVQRCLAKDPRNRYPSAELLLADLYVSVEAQTTAMPKGKRTIGTAAAATAALVIVAVIIFTARRYARHPTQVSPQQRRAMLAVLPFENLSGDPSQEYLSDGLTEDTITEFGRLSPERLGVIARTSTMRYKNARADTRTIARELGVDYIVEGSVRRAGNRVRVAAQLVRAADGTEIWADTYDRTFDDALALEAELARGVASAVQIQVLPARVTANSQPANAAARDALLRGRYHLHLGTSADRVKAVEYMRQAIAIDPSSAAAYAGLAMALQAQSTFDYAPKEMIPQARAAVEKALQLDDSLGEAHRVFGLILLEYYWNWPDAERELQRAIVLDPNNAAAHSSYATLLVSSGRFQDGLAQARQAQALDPVSPSSTATELFQLLCARRWNEVINGAQRVIDLQPRHALAHTAMAIAYARLGNRAAALATADKVLTFPDVSPIALAQTAWVYAAAGETQKARALLAKLQAAAEKRFVCFVNVGAVYASLGDIDAAFSALERGYKDRTG